MISLLRKTRRQFLTENKFTKYLVYAVGEIILIVIGILIALGINNWNQDRLIRKKEQFYLAGLQHEFEQSKTKLENLMEVNQLNYESSKKIAGFINDENSQPDEKQLSALLYHAFSYEINYNPNNSLLNELISSGGLKDISNTALRMHLTAWESIIQSINRQERGLREQRERVLDLFRTNTNSVRTILDHSEISTREMGLAKSKEEVSNLGILESREFENNLLMFILTGMMTEASHYKPLLEEIDIILQLIEAETDK